MAPNQSITFSPREMEVLALAWQCMETQPKIDVAKLAALTGYTQNSASVTFNRIKQKIRTLADSASGAPSIPSTPRKTKKAATPTSTARKRKNAATAADAMPGTPSKKSKKAGQDEVQEEGDDEQLFPDMVSVKKEEDKDDFFGGDNDFVLLSGLQG